MQRGRRRPPNAHDGGDELRAGRGEVSVHRRHRPRGDRRRLPAASLLGGRRAREREHVRGRARGGARSIALRAGGRPRLPAARLLHDESPAELPGRSSSRPESSRTPRPGSRRRPWRARSQGPCGRTRATCTGKRCCSTARTSLRLGGPTAASTARPRTTPSGGLGATTNVQGQFAAALTPPRDFISVESSERVRNSAAERDALSQTIGAVVGAP